MRWTTGFYYLDIKHEGYARYDLDFSGTTTRDLALFGFSGVTDSAIDVESWAIFGHLEYDLNEQWGVIAALRYTEDDRDTVFDSADICGAYICPGFPYIGFSSREADPNGDLFNQSFENVSAKVELDWRPTDDTLVYLSFNRGHKSGASRVTAGGLPATPLERFPHDEEVLHSVEGGIKTSFWDGRARLSANVFYYDYKDYQAFVAVPNVIPGTLEIINLDGDAVGGEIELVMSPADGVDLLLGASFIDSEVKDVPLPIGTTRDSELPYSPSVALNGLARYEWPALGGMLAIQADFNYSDDFCFSVLCAPLDKEDSYVVGNVRVSYTTLDERWKLAAFVNNVSDTEYRIYTLDISALSFGTDAFANPRWAGGTITFNWK